MKAQIQSNSIQQETQKAFLIKVPKQNYAFWFPKKFINFFGKNNYMISIWFWDECEVNLLKHDTKTKVQIGEKLLSEVLEDYLV